MDPIASQQAALDISLVAPEKRLKIERCNPRIAFTKAQKEETYQIYPRLHNQDFVELLYEDDLLSFIKELGYSGNCEMLSAIRTDQMHQPWRTFAAVINRCISGKSTGLDRLRESRAQYGALIPDGMVNDDIKLSIAYKKYLDYATGKVPPKKARKFKKPASPKLKIVLGSPKEPTQKGKRGNSEDETDDFNDEDDDGGDDDDSGNDDNSGNDAQDSERTNSDDDENPSFTLKDYEEEE
ncbi:hypothetical protein Tco_0565810 [Tanacetum coccineum]